MYCLLRLAINSSRLHGKGIRSEATVGISNCMTDLLGGGGIISRSHPPGNFTCSLCIGTSLVPCLSLLHANNSTSYDLWPTFWRVKGHTMRGRRAWRQAQTEIVYDILCHIFNEPHKVYTTPGNRYMIYVTYVHISVSHTQDHYCITHRNMYSVYVQWGPGDRQELGVCIPTTWHGMCGRVLVNEVSNF